MVFVPHPIQDRNDDEMRDVVETAYQEIVCGSRRTKFQELCRGVVPVQQRQAFLRHVRFAAVAQNPRARLIPQ